MTITITEYKNQYEPVLGAYKYWHLIQFQENGYKYDCNMTHEGMGNLISALRLAGNTVTFINN